MGPDNETLLKREDLQWINNKRIVDVVNLGGTDYCSYTAFFFEANKQKVKSLTDQLMKLYSEGDSVSTKEENEKNRKQIDKILQDLKKEKVIITSFCSC